MTDAEKKSMLSVVRAAEYLLFESCVLKAVLLSHRIPQSTWERECAALMKDGELKEQVHARFQALYNEIEQSQDLSKVLEAFARNFPVSEKLN